MIRIYYHVCAINHYEHVIRDQLTKLIFSGLYKRADSIHVYVYGGDARKAAAIIHSYGRKLHIEDCNAETMGSERETFRAMYTMLQNDEDATKVLYLHSKGVTRIPMSRQIEDWRTYMEYHLIAQHQDCLNLLDQFDVVGLDYYQQAHPHFSGNFFWTHAKHFKRLVPLDVGQETSRHLFSETLILGSHHKLQNVKACQLQHSGVPLEAVKYQMKEYVDN